MDFSNFSNTIINIISSSHVIWLTIGFIGQALFFSRFLVQWLASERAGRSVMPTAFWYFSIFGTLILSIYAIHRRDPVFIAGQSVPIFVYLRNLYFIRREKRLRTEAAVGETS